MVLDLTSVLGSQVGPMTKGLPSSAGPMRLDQVGSQGWNVLAEDLPLPLLVLKRSALEHNLAAMADYCARRGLLLAPHGKTTMAPQLFEAQLRAGAWALTVASVQQAQVVRHLGGRRIVIANQVAGRANVRWLVEELAADEDLEVYSWVDSVAGVEALAAAAREHGLTRQLPVLLELGWAGGRTGVRDDADVDAVVAAVRASAGAVALVGLSVFEGLLAVSRVAPSAAGGATATVGLDDILRWTVSTAERLRAAGDLPADALLSGGGSASFDAVAEHFSQAWPEARCLLRPGCYVTHDHGMNDALSPLGRVDPRLAPGDVPLQQALELWTYVHSAPEPGLAFLTLGRRDAPFDAGLPVPLAVVTSDGRRRPLTAEVTGLNDQHCYLRHDGTVQVGDRVVLGISHPCTAFDKWQVIPVVDDALDVVDAIRTCF